MMKVEGESGPSKASSGHTSSRSEVSSRNSLKSPDDTQKLSSTSDFRLGSSGATVNKNVAAAFDPYKPTQPSTVPTKVPLRGSLLDEDDIEASTHSQKMVTTPGVAGFLEMEEEPSRTPGNNINKSNYEPIRTNSGLLLTHRRTPQETRPSRSSYTAIDDAKKKTYNVRSPPMRRSNEWLEVENPWSNTSSLQQATKMLSYMRLCVIASAIVLFFGTGVLVHHLRQTPSSVETVDNNDVSQLDAQTVQVVSFNEYDTAAGSVPDRVVLLPLPLEQQESFEKVRHPHGHGVRHLLADLRSEFDSWMQQHNKQYQSHQEQEKRFQIWSENHERILEKNERHGPCRLTKQPVFGHNHFSDLTPQEFQSQFLTGYTGPKHDELEKRETRSSGVFGPHIPVNRHPKVHRRLKEHLNKGNMRGGFNSGCKWYDISCFLRYIMEKYLYGLGGIMEPAYDADSYPMGKWLCVFQVLCY